MTRNETEGPMPVESSSPVSGTRNPGSPTRLVNEMTPDTAAIHEPTHESQPKNLELKTIFSHKIDIKHNKIPQK